MARKIVKVVTPRIFWFDTTEYFMDPGTSAPYKITEIGACFYIAGRKPAKVFSMGGKLFYEWRIA